MTPHKKVEVKFIKRRAREVIFENYKFKFEATVDGKKCYFTHQDRMA